MGKISGEEGFISLGPWGEEGGEYWAYKAEGPIMQITIRYGDVINSIVIESKSSRGVLIGSPSEFGGRGGPKKKTFCINTSVEQLSSISLTYGNYVGDSKPAIGSLYFNTDQNTYGVTSNRTSNFSSVSIPIKSGVIAGFHGRAESYINAFGMFVAPKVDHKGKNSGEERSISLGPWGGENGVDWAYKLDGPIMQITICYGLVIESIEFESQSDDGVVIEGSVKIGDDGGNNTKTFCIDSSKEQVSSIILTFRKYEREVAIHTLGINTNLRTYGPFGFTTGAYSVSIPIEGGVLTGFHGRLGRYINAIGVFVAPKINSTLPSSGKKVDGLHSIQDSDASTSKLKGKISDKEAEQKKEINGKEGWISLGPWGGEDDKAWVYKPDGPLLQICIIYGEAINSIVFASKSYDGVVIGSCKKIGCNGGRGTETICIDTSVEELLSINLTYEDFCGEVTIISFSIHTNLNKYGPFGWRLGASSLSIPIKGGVFAGLHGCVGTYITAIGVFLTPKVNSLLSIQDLDSAPKKDPDAAPTHHKGKNSSEERSISLGPWGGEDGVDWAYKLDEPIMQISICYGKVIESIVFESKSCDGVVMGSSKKIGGDGGDMTKTFCIDSSVEQVLSIFLTYGEFNNQVTIHSLCINTNLNEYGASGSRTGASSVSIPLEGGVLVGFHGRLANYITAIGIFVAPKVNSLSSPQKKVDSLFSIQDPDSAPSQPKGMISDKEAEQKKQISGEEEWISLGPWPWWEEYHAYWDYKPDGPILQICILFGDVIDSIVFASKSYDGIVIGSPKKIGNSTGGHQTNTICIDTSAEQLLSISLTYENDHGQNGQMTIISLSIHTNLNNYGPFGAREAASCVCIPIVGGVFAGFHGRVEKYITAIGVFVAPKINSLLSIQDLDSAPKKDLDAAPTQHKGKNSGDEGLISLGPWGGKDGVDWAYKLNGPIMQITIRYGQKIESIVFESKSYDGGVIEGSEKIGGDGGYNTKKFCIDSSKEQVSSIILTFGKFMGQVVFVALGIKTNLTTYGPFGSTTGASSVSIPIEGGVLTGFHGRLGRYINAIGVFVAPKIKSTLPSSGKKVDGLHSIQDSDASTSKLKGKISAKEAEQKKEISGKEGWISLGPWGGESGKDWVYRPDGPLLQICIVYGEAINSIVFASKSYDGVVIGSCKKIGCNGGSDVETICINTSVEELLSISLTYGNFDYEEVTIISFSIHTNLNKYGAFGSRSGDSSLSIPIKGGVFAGLHGRVRTGLFGSCITAIGVLLTPKVNSLLSIQDLDFAPKKDPDAVPTHHKGKNSGEEGSISLGPWGGKDGVDWAYKLDRTIMEITIRYGRVIESIVFKSKSDDGAVIEGFEKIGGDGGDKIETFCIDSSKEQVSSIMLTFRASWMNSFRINTNLRTYGPFGSYGGTSSMSIPIEGGVLTGFHGRLGPYINAIGVFVAPKINSTLPSSGKKVDGLHSIQDSDASTSQLKGKISDKEAERKKEISGKEGWISLGPWGGEDGKDWVYKPDGPLLQICIVYGEAIDSIVFASKSYDGVVIGSCKKIGDNCGSEIETICIDTSVEELLSIKLTYERYYGQVTIISFSIHTNLNNYGPFGSRLGASFLSIPIKGGFFAGLHGRVGTYITAIGVLLTPKVNSLLSIQDLDYAPKKDPDAAPAHHKGKISSEDRWISLGPWGEKDGKEWAYKPEMPKMKISIRYGRAIHSISSDGIIIGRSEIIADTRGHVTETFCIDTSEEQLSSISLTYGSLSGKVSIMSLCFYTNLNKYGPFGLRSGASSVSIPIEGGVIAGFHGYTSTYLSALGIYVVPKFNRLHSIRDSTSVQHKVLGSGEDSKPNTPENLIHNAASSSSSANTNKDDHRDGAPSPSSEMIRKALHLVDSAFQNYRIHMDKQISEAHKKLEKLQKLRSSESDFVELGKDIEKLKFQIPLTSTNKEDHHDGALSPTSKMIRGNLILVDMAFAKAKESMYHTNVKINQAHEEFNRLQSLKSSERDSDKLLKAESDQKRKADSDELQKAIAKLKVQTSSQSKTRSANSNLHRYIWDNINMTNDEMMHLFYEEPDPHTIDGGLLEAFRKLPEPLPSCLSCFFKFPPMATIKRTSMIYIWIGQGYISQYLHHNEGYIWDVEVHAYKIFDELIAKGFIEPIYENYSFEPDSCRMSLSVRSSLYKEAKDRGFTPHNPLDHSCLINVGEAIIHGELEIFKNMNHSTRSLYLGRWQNSATHHIELTDAKILHGLNKKSTFLSLRGISMITELPTVISELKDLMIFDLRACHNLEVIPKEIGLFKSLTHLDMSECYLLEQMPKSLAQLSNLQVLKGFLIGDFKNKKSCTLRDLSRLSKLRKLNIYISGKDILKLEDLENLKSFEGLKKLTMSWGGCSLQAQGEDITKAFQIATVPPRLQKLNLQGFPMTSLPDCLMPGKLKKLEKLYIRGGKLCDLGQFQEQWTVEILSLKYLSDLKVHWSELIRSFPKLIYLNKVQCPMSEFPCDKRGVWMNEEAIDTHMKLQKYLKFSGKEDERVMGGM